MVKDHVDFLTENLENVTYERDKYLSENKGLNSKIIKLHQQEKMQIHAINELS
jgi:hypothetical protein